jgi:hypothetical protein
MTNEQTPLQKTRGRRCRTRVAPVARPPYAGMTQIRCKGYVLSLGGTPWTSAILTPGREKYIPNAQWSG